MTDYLSDIFERIASREYSEADIAALQQVLQGGEGRSLFQLGKYNITIGEGQNIQIGDRTFVEINDAAVQAIVAAIQSSTTSKTPEQIDFQPYLRSLVDTYKGWWRYYTLTDATGKIQESESESPLPFDFGLMVQSVPKEKDSVAAEANPLQEKQEKIERLPVLEGICKYVDDHVLLVGRPGSGKSTALIRLLLETATQALKQGSGQIPILVELRYWQTSITDRIQAFLHKHNSALSLDDNTLSSLLRQGHFLLLVDGLNELSSETARTQLASFRQDYSKVPMIFTTRDLGLGGDLGIEKKLEMQPLTVGQMQAFIRAYVPDQAEAMLLQLNDRLREFGQTPLLLWMLCEVFQQSPEHQMPSNLAGIFQAFTRMYEESSVRKHEVALLKGDVRPLSDRRLWKPALKALAAVMMQGETPVDFRAAIHRDEAEQELSRIFPDENFPVRDILDDLLKYHLLQNRSADQIEFRHQLLQEYYAAEYLLRLLPNLNEEELKRDYLNLLKWTEPIALLLALVDEEDQALRLVKLAIDDVDLILGARLIREIRFAFQTVAINCIANLELPPLLKAKIYQEANHFELAIDSAINAFDDTNDKVREEAVRILGEVGNERAIVSLIAVLKDVNIVDQASHDVRGSIAEALKKIGSERAVEYLLITLDDPDHAVRWGVVDVLRKIGDNQAISGLIAAIEYKDSDASRKAAWALERISNEKVVAALIKCMEHEKAKIRVIAASILGKLNVSRWGQPSMKSAVNSLIKGLSDQNYYVRKSVIAALGQTSGNQAVDGLLIALKDKEAANREEAARALGKIGSERALEGLLNALKDTNSQTREKAAWALGKIGSKRALEELYTVLQDTNIHVRRRVEWALREIRENQKNEEFFATLDSFPYKVHHSSAESLEQLKDKVVIDNLLNNLNNVNSVVRNKTAELLGQIGSVQAIPGLLQTLRDSDHRVSMQAANALIRIGSEEAIKGLSDALQSSSRNACVHAAAVLMRIDSDKTISKLLQALENLDDIVSSNAAIALGEVGNEAAIPGLLEALQNSRNDVRPHVADALGRIGGDLAIPGLTNALQNPNNNVRLYATECLGKIGGDLAIPGLTYALQDPNENIRFRAAALLGNFGGKQAIEELLKALQDPDQDVRYRAAGSLVEIGDEQTISGLLYVLQHSNDLLYKRAARVLGKVADPRILPELWARQLNSSRLDIYLAISDIQNRCKFYSYEVLHGIIP